MKAYRIFLDMDGVLVDFEKGVRTLTGTSIREFAGNLGKMWKAVAGVGDFYTKLDWLPTGKELWETLAPLNPIILTGIPHGHGWGSQKQTWVKRHLNPLPDVIIKAPGRTKIQCALATQGYTTIPDDEVWILIDDTPKMCTQWSEGGGLAIHHKETANTIIELLKVSEVREDLKLVLTN